VSNSDLTISKQPDIPSELLGAIDSENLSIFTGAGVSRVLGCWSWKQLSIELVEKCYEKGRINYRQREILSDYDDYKRVITICRNVLAEGGFEEDFFQTIVEGCKGDDEKVKNIRIYDELNHIPALFITTNFDEHFDEKFHPDRIVLKEEGFRYDLISPEKLYHIHGSVRDYSTLVLTVPDYLERYNSDDFRQFLRTVFSERAVLFIGYGMAEFELLDFLIGKYDVGNKKARFILHPYFRGYEDIVRFDQFYYRGLGVRIIPYEYDEKGYTQLYDVIRFWNETIDRVSAYPYEKMKEIDKIVGGRW